MKKCRFNIVTDGMWGSTGKGLICSALAYRYQPDVVSNTNMANAGHTIVSDNIEQGSFVAKALPSAAILNKWYGYEQHIFIGATAAFHLETMLKEIEQTQIGHRLTIHPRAGVITQQHREAENDGQSSTKHLASTMQGCGTFLADKVLRKPELKLARDYTELERYMPDKIWSTEIAMYLKQREFDLLLLNTKEERHTWFGTESPHDMLHTMLEYGATILHEGAQGFSLDINHGSHYPQCTSRGTTAIQNIADMGLNISQVGDIYLVIRPYPIRVGNVIEDGVTKGHSGGCYPDQHEITWAEVCDNAGAPEAAKEAILTKELTTVTKRLRRVFTFSPMQYKEAVAVNGATKIALNFANYIDWSVTGANSYKQLTYKVCKYIEMLEDLARVPVAIVGTGPRICDVVYLD